MATGTHHQRGLALLHVHCLDDVVQQLQSPFGSAKQGSNSQEAAPGNPTQAATECLGKGLGDVAQLFFTTRNKDGMNRWARWRTSCRLEELGRPFRARQLQGLLLETTHAPTEPQWQTWSWLHPLLA